jgi:predicted PurR-regulated permease PerM
MATAALVLGILAVITSFTVFGGVILGLLAVIFGVIGLRRANRGVALGRGRAIAGIILGLLGIVLAVALVAIGVSVLNSPEGKNLQDCLKSAGSDQSQVQKCQDQFRNQVGS